MASSGEAQESPKDEDKTAEPKEQDEDDNWDRGVRRIVSQCGDTIELTQAKGLWKAVHLVEQTMAAHQAAQFLIGFQMAYELNNIVNGERDISTKESQAWYSQCVTVRNLFYVLTSEFVTTAGSWWGRKAIMRMPQTCMMMTGLICMLAHIVQQPFVFILANIPYGSTSGIRATMSAYIADVSTEETHKRNMAYAAVWMCVGMTVGVGCYVFVPVMACYIVALSAVGTSFLLREFLLPDWSPPLTKRAPPSFRQVLDTLVPCNIYKTYKVQSPYTKALIWVQFFQLASIGAMVTWFQNYALVRFAMGPREAGAWVTVLGIGGSVFIFVGLTYLPITMAKWMIWANPLFPLFIMFDWGPSTMWLGLLFYWVRIVPLSQLDTIYYGQVSARLRHELAGLENMCERLGVLTGSFATLIYSPMWMENYQEGDGSLPALPVVSLVFDVMVVVIFYGAAFRLGHHDQYGKHFMMVKPDTSSTQDRVSVLEDANNALEASRVSAVTSGECGEASGDITVAKTAPGKVPQVEDLEMVSADADTPAPPAQVPSDELTGVIPQ